MAERTNFYDAEDTAGEVNTGTSYTNTVTSGSNPAQILGSALAANTKYLIVARGLVGSSSLGNKAGVRVQTDDDTAIAAKSEMFVEFGLTGADDKLSYFFAHSFTTDGTPADVEIQIFRDGGTVRIDQSSLWLIDLDAIGTAGTNYFESITPVSADTISTAAETTILAQLSGSDLGTDEQVIFGYGRVDSATTNRWIDVSLFACVDVATAVEVAVQRRENEDTAEQTVGGFGIRHKASSGTPNVTIYGLRENAGAAATDGGGYLIALPAVLFEDVEFDYTAGGISVNGETTIASKSYTPTTDGNHLVMAMCSNVTGTADQTKLWIEDGTTEIRTGDSTPTHTQHWDVNKDKEGARTFERRDITGAVTFNVSADRGAAVNVEHRWLLIVSLEAFSGVVAGLATETDTALPVTVLGGTPDFEQITARAYTDGHISDGVLIAGGAAPTLETDVTYAYRTVIERNSSTGTYTGQLEAQKNAEAFFDVTGSSTIARTTNSAAATDDEDTLERLTSPKTYVNGKCDDRNGATTAVVLTSTQNTELVFYFQLRSADLLATDTVKLRVRNTHADGDATFTEVLTIDVDIPTRTLPGVVWTGLTGIHFESMGFPGPWFDSLGAIHMTSENGAVVSVRTDPEGPEPMFRQSLDGGKLWQLVDPDAPEDEDTGNGTSPLFDGESIYVPRSAFAPATLGRYHVAILHNTSGNLDMVPVHTSDHATTPDTWRFADAEDLPGTARSTEEWVTLVERSDGDRVALYGQALSSLDRVAYDREVSGVWQGETLVDNAVASTNYGHGEASRGLSDRVVFAWVDSTNNELHCRALVGGTLETITTNIEGAQTVKNFLSGEMTHPMVELVLFDTTNDKHLLVWLDNSDKLWSVVLTWNGGTSQYDAGTPEQVSTTSVDSDFPTGADHTGVNAGLAADYDTGDVYCMFIDNTTRDVHRIKWTEGGGWETEVEVYTATGDTDRAMYVSCDVGTHSVPNGGNTVLAFIYTVCDITVSEGSYVDGSAFYDELVIATAAPVVRRRQLTTVRM